MQEQGLILANDGFIGRISRIFRRFFLGQADEVYLASENVEIVRKDKEVVQMEIINAQRAFRKYVINNNKNISSNILSFIISQLDENEEKIRKIIEINKDLISYEEIKRLFEEENNYIKQFKMRNKKTDCYQVPIGVIATECEGTLNCVKYMIKAISTRNAIIILNKKFNKYSTESLILLIIKECLRNYYVDDNIIQMFETEEIAINQVDRFINEDEEKVEEAFSKVVYLYQEDDDFKEEIEQELDRLKNMKQFRNYEIKIIKGDFANVVNFLNKKRPFAVCMYTQNVQRAYKFLNWINTVNLFINTGINNCKNIVGYKNLYFNLKNLCHKNIF